MFAPQSIQIMFDNILYIACGGTILQTQYNLQFNMYVVVVYHLSGQTRWIDFCYIELMQGSYLDDESINTDTLYDDIDFWLYVVGYESGFWKSSDP